MQLMGLKEKYKKEVSYMKMIDKNNRIFSSEEFQKDKYKFNLILQNLNSENLELYSDEENCIVCRGSKE